MMDEHADPKLRQIMLAARAERSRQIARLFARLFHRTPPGVAPRG